MPNRKKKSGEEDKRARISQANVPAYSLDEALRVAKAISSQYGGKPTKPLNVAKAMDLSPTSSGFKMLTGASIAYGLTEGGYNAGEISLTSLGKQIVTPLEEGADQQGMVLAYLKPKVISDFTTKYDGNQIPREDIAINVLTEMGVPKERAKNVLDLITKGAESLGLISEIKGKKYLNLSSDGSQNSKPASGNKVASQDVDIISEVTAESQLETAEKGIELPQTSLVKDGRAKRVFITHGKNTTLIPPIKKLLSFGELEAVVR